MPALLLIVVFVCAAGIAFPAVGDEAAGDAPPEIESRAKALRDAGEPAEPADLKTWPALPDPANAAKVVAAASAALTTPEARDAFDALTKTRITQWELPLSAIDRDELLQLTAKTAAVLRDLGALATLDGYDWGAAPPSPMVRKRDGFPGGIWVGYVAHLLYLDGLLATEQGDAARAWRRAESLRRLADGVAQHPEFERVETWRQFHQLAAMLAAHAVAGEPFDDRAAGGRDRALGAIRYWLDERPTRDALVREYQLQRVAIIDTYRRIGDGTIVPPKGLTGGNYYHANLLLEQRIGLAMWPDVVDLYTAVIDALRTSDALSYGASYAQHRETLTGFSKRGGVALYVASNLGAGFSSRHESAAELRAHQKLAAVAVAVRLYRLDHQGVFPPTLDALVPAYLPAVPSDPTVRKGDALSIRYRSDGPDPLAWACGPNGRDDAGRTPIKAVRHSDQWKDADFVVRLLPAKRAPAGD